MTQAHDQGGPTENERVDAGGSDLEQRLARYERGWRLGRGSFSLAWVVVVAVSTTLPMLGYFALGLRGLPAVAFAVGTYLAVKLVGAVVVAARLRDLGRPLDDMLWGFVPVGDLVLLAMLSARTPPTELRERRVRAWMIQTGAFAAYGKALPWMAASAPAAWVVALPAILLVALGGEAWRDRLEADAQAGAGSLEAWRSAALVALAFGLGWTVLQLGKRHRASRASWLPTLLVVPAALLAGGAAFAAVAEASTRTLLPFFFTASWDLSVGTLVGGVVTTFWIFGLDRARRGLPAGLGAVWGEASGSLGDVTVAWAARTQIVQLGAQLVVVGIWLAISYAFTDLIAALRPERPMFEGSSRLTRGIRGKIFTILTVWFVLVTAGGLLAALPFATPEQVAGAIVDPSTLPLAASLAADVVWWLVSWWTLAAMLVVFHERDALLLAHQARQQQAAPPAAPAPAG